jgi:hypothetical protein
MTRTHSKTSDFLSPAPPDYIWPRCPEADQFIEETCRAFLDKHAFARWLSGRMKIETSTLFSVWVDHLLLPVRQYKPKDLEALGFLEDKKVRRPAGAAVFCHPYADLPRVVISSRIKEKGCAIMVDDLWRFQLAHHLSMSIEGAPYSTYRFIRLPEGAADFYVVERRGSLNLVPDVQGRGETYLDCFEQWAARRRHFDSETQGMKETLKLARQIAKKVGTGPAATLFLEGERLYWQSRNQAAEVQKARQDRLGLGWANHDHHTFRSSRSCFPMLIDIFLAFGFKKRERYYAGKDAGWGAQIMEQPEAGVIIFADVDLAPEDVTVDFSKVALPDLEKPRTVGLWCALHGESILQAGMHHLEAKFDFDQLKKDLQDKQIETMPPFSDFSFLRQAFTKAEMWRVPEVRLNALRQSGKVSEEAYQQIKTKGAVGSHMENLQRHDGFKGFNQKGVSEIIAAVNPEKQALSKSPESSGA